MKVFRIVFKNSYEQLINQEIANHIRDTLLSGTKTFLCATDTNGNLIMAINLLEVEYIIDIDYKV